MNATVSTDLAAAHAEIAELRQRIEFLEWQALSMSTFAKVMERADIVLFSMDPEGVTTMSDGKGLERLGHKPGERVGKNELEATRGTPAHDYLLRALAGEAVRATVEPAPGVFFDTWYMPLRNENNEAGGVLGMAIDATQRVQADRQLALKTRVIEEQVATIRDLASPIIKVWDEVLCLPIIGAVDAARASEMMENLLESIVREEARFAILDLTGVTAMDTSTVHHILRIFGAARTLGVEGVLSGVQPAVAQTAVSLGIDLDPLRMVRTLHDALAWCLKTRQADADTRARLPWLRRTGGPAVKRS
jgi:rsbT co-antagonist protein RsbR